MIWRAKNNEFESPSIPHQIELRTETTFFLRVRKGKKIRMNDLPNSPWTSGDSSWIFLFVSLCMLYSSLLWNAFVIDRFLFCCYCFCEGEDVRLESIETGIDLIIFFRMKKWVFLLSKFCSEVFCYSVWKWFCRIGYQFGSWEFGWFWILLWKVYCRVFHNWFLEVLLKGSVMRGWKGGWKRNIQRRFFQVEVRRGFCFWG